MKFFNHRVSRLSFPSVTVLVFILVGCSGCPPECVAPDEALLSNFNAMANPSALETPDDNINCFIDYSNGMGEKFSGVADNYDKIINYLKGQKVKYFKIGESDEPLEIPQSEADFRNKANYTSQVSKLAPALKKMKADKNSTSIFITDFEKIEGAETISNPTAPTPYLKHVDKDAWAQNEFREWIKDGNQVDIFAMDYGYGNNIYAIVFTPGKIVASDRLYNSSLVKKMTDALPGVPHFSYSAMNFKIEQEKKADEIGDANDNLIVYENITQTKDKGFEYYSFESKDLVSFVTDESQKDDRRIINKIKVTSNNECFSNVTYGINVYDVTNSLDELSQSANPEPLNVETNSETGEKDTLNKAATFHFQRGPKVEDVFDAVYNTETHEIGIKLKPDFTGVAACKVFQIDIVPAKVTLKDFSREDNLFQLIYSGPYSIRPLKESIVRAMEDVSNDISSKAIYTVYIKITK